MHSPLWRYVETPSWSTPYEAAVSYLKPVVEPDDAAVPPGTPGAADGPYSPYPFPGTAGDDKSYWT